MTVKIPNFGGYKIDPSDINKDNPETSRTKDDTSNDEHIACLEKQIADLQGKVERVRNFGRLQVSDTRPQEPRTTIPMCPHFHL
ncbi:hypothetical protein RDI58_007267 [Solanum bulbocastanum]|uniref:Uncharacterized protein n=1 Tax=Solanum bulbocastanum TaxID=147425 RepID=A0AAN8TUF4_SOLBU